MNVLVRKRIVSLSLQTLLFSSSAKVLVPTAEFLTTQHHISPETALKVSSTISHLKNPRRTDLILSCLKQTGFSTPQIDLIINKSPRILSLGTELVKAKLNSFHNNGFSASDTIDIISKIPWVLYKSENRISESIRVMKATLGSTEDVCRALKISPWFLYIDLEKTMIPNIDFLMKHCKLSSSQVTSFMMLFPRFMLLQPKNVVEGARRVDQMGLNWTPKSRLYAVYAVCSTSVQKLELKMSVFRRFGFSTHVVFKIFNRYPLVFTKSEKKIKETMGVFLGSGRADPSIVLTNPALFSYSLEKRIKPRLEVVELLEKRDLLLKKLKLSTILTMSNKKFLESFVLSNAKELGDDFVTCITKKMGLKS